MSLLDGLTHWWDLDEEGGTRLDSHGLKDLTDRNTVGSVVVGSGRAASFVAANDEQLYSTPILGPGPGVPFAFVVRFRIPESGGGGDLFTPCTTGQKLIIDETGKLTQNILHATQSWDLYVYADSAPGSWHRAVVNFDGSTVYLYVDGEYVSSVAGRRKTGSSNDRLGIGNCDNIFDKGGVPLQGDIDFVGYWHERALTEEEIIALQSVTSYADLSGGTPEPVTLTGLTATFPITPHLSLTAPVASGITGLTAPLPLAARASLTTPVASEVSSLTATFPLVSRASLTVPVASEIGSLTATFPLVPRVALTVPDEAPAETLTGLSVALPLFGRMSATVPVANTVTGLSAPLPLPPHLSATVPTASTLSLKSVLALAPELSLSVPVASTMTLSTWLSLAPSLRMSVPVAGRLELLAALPLGVRLSFAQGEIITPYTTIRLDRDYYQVIALLQDYHQSITLLQDYHHTLGII